MRKAKDIAWQHCKKVPNKPNGTQCNYCDKVFAGGGITRFKYHMAGDDKNVEMCKKQGPEVRKLFQKMVDNKKRKKLEKMQATPRYQEAVCNTFVDSEEENQCNTESGKQLSLVEQWDRDQMRGLESIRQCQGSQRDRGTEVVKSTRELAPTHYTFKIESFSLLSMNLIVRYESNVFEAGGYKWKLALYPNGNNKINAKGYISIYLVMADTSSRPSDWEVNVLFSLYLYDQIRDKYVTFEDKGGEVRRFHQMKTEWGYSRFMPLETFVDSSNGYLINDTCVFGAEVFVCKKTGQGEVLSMMKDVTTFNFTWKVERLLQLQEDYYFSEVFSAGTHKCKIKLYPKGVSKVKDAFLSVYLWFDDLEPISGNKAYAKYKLRIRDQKLDDHIEHEAITWFSASFRGQGKDKFMELGTLKDPRNGFLVDDTCIVEAEVTVLGSVDSFN